MTLSESLKANVEHLIGEGSLTDRLKKNKPLKIKLGVDPTRPDLTFGHMVVFNKLRQFQEAGHDAVLIIGDFTAMIGDPSGRSTTRPILSKEEVKANAETYLQQAFKIINEKQTVVRYNSEWFSMMGFEEALQLARKMTVARMLERDDFQKRYQENAPISIVEFLYPLLQGYDSVVVQSDIELGGTDQLFNLLVGRALQKEANQPEQAVLTLPLLLGLEGKHKMSKSLDNYIAFNDAPKDMFGKIMSVSDALMWDYYRLLLETPEQAILSWQSKHPMEAKKNLAFQLTAKLHNHAAAQHEQNEFAKVFSQRGVPDLMPELSWKELKLNGAVRLIDLLSATQLLPSKKEARRMIEQGGVKIDDKRYDDPLYTVTTPESAMVIQVGKRKFLRVIT